MNYEIYKDDKKAICSILIYMLVINCKVHINKEIINKN